MNYVDPYSYKSLLGTQSKNIKEYDWGVEWFVNKNRIVVIYNYDKLNYEELSSLVPFNYLYFEKQVFEGLSGFTIKKHRQYSIDTTIPEVLYVGKEWKSIRYTLNRAEKYNIEVKDGIDLSCVEGVITKWRENLRMKYFQDHSAKNIFFYKNNFHENCINKCFYIDGKPVGFATMGPPNENGYGIYIIRKALCDQYYGLTEFMDTVMIEAAKEKGMKTFNWGQGEKSLLRYKAKFPKSEIITHYNGKILEKE